MINRRAFLKTSGLSVAGLTIAPAFWGCTQQSESTKQSINALFNRFKSPGAEARPFFRWWWNGNAVKKDELLREIKVMKAAGAGGVEVNPIALREDDPEIEENAVDWLSDEWNRLLKATADACKENEMITDVIVGTGWPFGGEFLSADETIKGVRLYKITANGPQELAINTSDFLPENGHLIEVALIPSPVNSIDDRQVIEPVPDQNKITVKVPEGEYIVSIIYWEDQFREVLYGAPGGAGPVLDHFDAEVVEKYLNRMSDALKPHFDGNVGSGVRAFFCDSIELEGANWTDDMESAFYDQHGYALRPYLPFLIEQPDHITDEFAKELRRVRYDFSVVLASLFTERFINTYHSWCHESNVKSRYQAYGHPWLYMDLLNGNMIPDIPEGDQWLYNGGWAYACEIDQIRYAIWNKYASSGGHLMGRKIISSEAMTNTRGVFGVSLEHIKQATDLNIVAGINHLVLHGFNYAPPEEGFPGRMIFGCYFNEQNTFWPYFKLWADYTSRICEVFQSATPVTQVAIMGPTPDVWSDHGLDRNPFNQSPWYLHCLWQALNHNGYMTDYVNSDVLLNAVIKDGKLKFNDTVFELLIMCEVETVDPKVLQKVSDFVQAGGKVLMVGKMPQYAPGKSNAEKRNQQVLELMQSLRPKVVMSEAPGANEEAAQYAQMEWAGKVIERTGVKPLLGISNPDPALFTIQYNYDKQLLTFFTNVSRESTIDCKVKSGQPGMQARVWDPETGQEHVCEFYNPENGELSISLSPIQSVFVIIGEGQHPEIENTQGTVKPDAQLLSSKWSVTFYPAIEGASFTKEMDQLMDWREDDKLKHFSGKAVYEATFEADDTNYSKLDLGIVYDIAEVKLNGQELGVKWYGEKVFSIEGKLKAGENRLEVTVVNLLHNYCKALAEHHEQIAYWMDRTKVEGLMPSGLIGPVKLV